MLCGMPVMLCGILCNPPPARHDVCHPQLPLPTNQAGTADWRAETQGIMGQQLRACSRCATLRSLNSKMLGKRPMCGSGASPTCAMAKLHRKRCMGCSAATAAPCHWSLLATPLYCRHSHAAQVVLPAACSSLNARAGTIQLHRLLQPCGTPVSQQHLRPAPFPQGWAHAAPASAS
jgi:hypothetical protein